MIWKIEPPCRSCSRVDLLFPFQFSVHHKERGHLEQEGNCPGNRVGDIQALRGMELGDLENGVDPANPDTADTQNGDHHGDKGFAQTPEGTGGHIHETTQAVGHTYFCTHTTSNTFFLFNKWLS